MTTCDVAIVGGGPAGAVTAILLARRHPDWRITLWEAHATPAPKPCGEFVAPLGCAVLRRAGLLEALKPLGITLHRLTLAAPHGAIAADLPDEALGIRRERLDGHLLAIAATLAELRRGARIARLEAQGDAWVLHGADGSTTTAALVIGADGRHSRVRQWAGLGSMRRTGRHALTTRATGLMPPPGLPGGEMHLSPLGQVGVCPVGDSEVNLNLLLSPEAGRMLTSHRPQELFHAALASTPTLMHRWQRTPFTAPVLTVAQLRQVPRAAATGTIALVGDAALCGDPFTGEGLTNAFNDAELLAAHCEGWRPGTSPAPALTAYAEAHHRAHRRHRFETRALPWLLDHRQLAEVIIAVLGHLPCARRLITARHAA